MPLFFDSGKLRTCPYCQRQVQIGQLLAATRKGPAGSCPYCGRLLLEEDQIKAYWFLRRGGMGVQAWDMLINMEFVSGDR